jgi:DNA invertase Pin-like site-specific DNA recombinase
MPRISGSQDSEKKTVICAIYTRVSTDKQAMQGLSLGQQEADLKDYAAMKGWQVLKVYEDAGESGKTMERPSVRKLFEDAAARKFSKLLISKLDRWARNTRDFYNTYDRLSKYGVSLLVPDQVPDTDSATGKAFMGFLAVFAELEGSIIKGRAINTTEHLKADGRVLGHLPYGYTPGFHTVVPDEEKLRTVRRVYDLFQSAHSQRDIARMLAVDGLTRDIVRGILTNPIYAGMVAYGRGKVAGDQRKRKSGGVVEPSGSEPKPTIDKVKKIVSYEEWCQVQEDIRNNFRHAQAKTSPLFQHLLYCSTCHHFLSAHGDAKGRTKYACENDREGRVKIGIQTGDPQPDLTGRHYCGQQLWEHYLEFPVIRVLDEAVREWKPEIDLSQEIKDLQTKLSRSIGVENREKADMENPEKPYEIAAARMKKAHAVVEAVHQRLDALKEENASQELVKRMLKEGFMEFYYNKRRTKEQKQGILQHLIRRIDVGSQELTITWLFMRDGKRRIPRSAVDPKGGHGKPQKYDPKAQKRTASDDCIARQNASKKTPSGVSDGRLVEIGGLEPPTSCMPCRRSPS